MRLGYGTRLAVWTVVACAFVVFVTGAAGASGSWGVGVEAVLPANAVKAGQSADINSISCPSFGNCTAVGTYFDSSGNQEGLLLTETAGAWATGVEAVLPANAAATNGLLHLDAVSCASPGNCSAVGGYTDTSRNDQGLLLTETAGTWSKGVEAVAPGDPTPDDQNVAFPSVSCPSPGNCVAVGDYRDATGNMAVSSFTETAGIWSAGVAPSLPANASATHYSNLQSVSCPSVGNCSAVGNFTGSQGYGQALMLKEIAGKWATGSETKLPAGAISNQLAALDSVSCASAGNCSAVGTYYDDQGQEVLLLSEMAGSWAAGVEATLPSNAATVDRYDTLVPSISCASVGNCVAVGGYENNSGTEENPGTEEPLLLNETNGTWAAGVEAHLPADRAPLADSSLVSVSCASAGNCDAVGGYVDNSGDLRGVLVNETAGSWATGVEATLPSNAAGPGAPFAGTLYPVLSSVSCAGPGSCNAGGSYVDSAGYSQAFHLGTIPPLFTLKISKNGTGAGTVTSSPAGISCGSTCSHNYSSGTQVTLTASAGAGSTFAGWSGSGCSGTGTCKVTMSAAMSVTARFTTAPPPPLKCVVPNVKGKKLAAAKSAIKSHQCSIGKITRVKSPKHRGKVISQSPKVGKHLPKGSEIALKVAK